MQIEQSTLSVLKNFSTINSSIMINPGSVLKTISPNKSIMAKAKIKQNIEDQMAIYDISNFLSAISMFESPILDFNEDNSIKITSKNDNRGIRYLFADPRTIVAAPDKELTVNNPSVTFKLTNKSITNVVKALGILNLPEIAIVGDGNKLTIQAVDSKKSQVSSYYDEIGVTDKNFVAYFKSENVKIIPNDYEVKIAPGISHFISEDIEYWIAVEQNSKF